MAGREDSCTLAAVNTHVNGRVLFHVRNKLIAMMKTFVAEDAKGNEVFRVRQKWGSEPGHLAVIMGDAREGVSEPKAKGIEVGSRAGRRGSRGHEGTSDLPFGSRCSRAGGKGEKGARSTSRQSVCICFDETKNDTDILGTRAYHACIVPYCVPAKSRA
jgi:hypothetical protein